MIRRLTMLALLVALAVAAAHADQEVSRPFAGVMHIARTDTMPRPVKIHVIDIDLAAPGIRFRLTPHAGPLDTIKQTTLEFLLQQKAQIAVNTHYFEPWPPPSPDTGNADLVGIAASEGNVYSPFESNPPKSYAIAANAPGLNIDARNRAAIVHRNPRVPSGLACDEAVELYNTVSGNEQIVAGGAVVARDFDWNNRPGPRTVAGLTAAGHLILCTVDGRQPGVSEGLKVGEVAAMLARDYVVMDAINLDGGGSTTLALADPTPRVVNVPVGLGDKPNTLRPVGASLAVFASPATPTSAATSYTASAPASLGRPPNAWPWLVGTAAAASVTIIGAIAVAIILLRRRS